MDVVYHLQLMSQRTLVRQDVDEVDDGVGAVLVCLPSSVSPEMR